MGEIPYDDSIRLSSIKVDPTMLGGFAWKNSQYPGRSSQSLSTAATSGPSVVGVEGLHHMYEKKGAGSPPGHVLMAEIQLTS